MERITAIRIAGIILLTVSTGAVAAPGGQGLLGDLPTFKNYEAARESSVDPTGGNADGRHDWPLKPGETRTIGDIQGAGAITHLWFTVASKDEKHLRNLVLRMYWDGEDHPSVESPLGDFFGLGHATYYLYSSRPIQIGSDKGLNCFWRMPFANGAKVTITNEGPLPCLAFYYYIDYQRYDALPEDTGRFHAQYRQEYPCVPNQNYLLLDATGRGHFVGCNLSVHQRAGAWWGEGDDMIYVDGAETPTLLGTGAEDYFCGAWCYGESSPIEFSNPYFGAPMIKGGHKQGSLWNVYRHHIEDPIPFKQSIKVTIEHGHANDRQDDYASVAYWYQNEPHVPFPPLPAPEDRMFAEATVYTEENYWGVVEAERWADRFKSDRVSTAPTEEYGNFWSFGKQLLFKAEGPDTFKAELPLHASDAGVYPFDIFYTEGPDYGECELWMNGEKLCAWDGYNEGGVARKQVTSPKPLAIKPESNILEVRVTGKNSKSGGFLAGLDCFRIRPW